MNRIKLGASLLTLGVVCGLVGPSFGVDRTWTGAGANANWSNTTNWVGGVVGGNWDGAIFDANTVNGLVTHDVGGGRGRIVLTNGLTQDVIFRNSSTEFIQSDTGFTITSDSRDLVLSLYGSYIRIWGAANLWSVGSGRTLTANCRLSEGKVDKRGAGTAIFARATDDNRVNVEVNEGTAKTVIDQAGSLNKWTVASGATWVFGAQNQAIYGLWGNGAVKSPTGDTVFMGPVTSVNGELISTSRNYVYKLDFGSGGGATVNGVVFEAAGTGGAGWSLSGSGMGSWGGDTGSGFGQMIYDFIFGSAIGTLTFSNLNVGTKYEAVIYAAPSWGSRVQNATFSNGTSVVVLRDTEPAFTGYYVYRFTAQSDKASITMDAVVPTSKYHWYGATLEDLTGVTAGSRAATLTVGDSNKYSFSGVLSGDIALVKQGSGTQSLSGTNAYSGATVISNGTLKLHAALVTPVAVRALSSYGTRLAIHAINGTGMSPSGFVEYDSTAGKTADNNMWLSNANRLPWITFDLGSVQTLSGIRLWNYNESTAELTRGIKTAGVYIGSSLPADGALYNTMGPAWGTLVTNMTFAKSDGSATLAGGDYLFAAPITTQYLQLYVTDNWGDSGYTGLSEIRFFSGATTNVLPVTTALSIASGGVLDISRVSQDVATLSGSGVVSNGTLGVTSALYPGGANVAGTLTLLQGLTLGAGASLYWDYSAGGADLVRVLGTANLPATATVRVSATDTLPVRATLFQCGTINAPSGVSGWTVVGGRANSRVVIQGNQVQLYSPRGTIISFY